MNFKIDTKEKFREIFLLEPHLSANMTEEMQKMFLTQLENEPKNIIVSLAAVSTLDNDAAEMLTAIQTHFYDKGASFVLCEIQKGVENSLETSNVLETMNIAPTLSEAWDIVQMEEIERELLGDWE